MPNDDEQSFVNRSRRAVLKSSAGLLAGTGLAGCLDSLDDLAEEGSADSGYAAFFTLWDWAEQVAGENVEFENPVEVGQIGHGWSPTGDITRDIAATDVFVYLDTPEFGWAQDIADTLERDHPDEIVVVDGLEGVDMLEWDHDHDHDHDHGHDDHHDDHGHDDHHDDHDHDDHHDDHDHDDHHDDHDHDHDHDHGDYDPHVWVDPVRAQTIVDTIADGLVEADPENEDVYRDNAEAYKNELAEIDEAFEELVAEAERDVAVLAGHDSFQYLEARYGFELHTPVGVSPDDRPSPSEIADTVEFVNEHGIDVILYDRFESPQLAEQIEANSDATEVVAITPAEGTTQEWSENGWGYVEQMKEINLPAFEKALN